ncbi:MAG: lipoyl synthase [spirochete symbiont of Stewartia floridana]|nr:MAG: lipoyl synthase [spirochete symbiont of Stewartia floridana]
MPSYMNKPDWLKIKLATTHNTYAVRDDLKNKELHTVCEEARCPNLHECWSQHRTAAFLILGNICTRACRFCAVKTGAPSPADRSEPARIAESVESLGISHAVITMVTRDDLPDGGAGHLAAVGRAVHTRLPETTVEYLSSDLMGSPRAIAALVESQPEILGHNVETVRRLTPIVRSRSDYDRTLKFLRTVYDMDKQLITKSSVMLGLGEEVDEVLQTLNDIYETGCRLVNIGQYLQPTKKSLPVKKYWHPDEFDALREKAMAMGFIQVLAGPLVRSSYHAGNLFQSVLSKRGGGGGVNDA